MIVCMVMINNTPLSFGVGFLLHSVARPDAMLDSIIRPLSAPTRVRGCILTIMIMVVVVDLIIIGWSMDLDVGVVLCIVVVIVVVCLVIIILPCAVQPSVFRYLPCRWKHMWWGRSVDVDMMVIVNVRRLR